MDNPLRSNDFSSKNMLLSQDLPGFEDLLRNPHLLGLTPPLHAVSFQVKKKSGKTLIFHYQAHKPQSKAFIRITKGLYVGSPELCFIQMATQLSFPRLVELGYELCGAYVLDPFAEKGFRKRPPLTTPAKLAAFIASAPYMKGLKAARKSVPYILTGSASPMETVLSMLLTLPKTKGGYGLPTPTLNKKVILSKSAQQLCRKPYLRCDLLWEEAQVSVEYDSAEYHLNNDQMEADAERKNALESMGIHVITVTKGQIRRKKTLDGIAREIARNLGVRIRPRSKDYLKRQFALRFEILPWLREKKRNHPPQTSG